MCSDVIKFSRNNIWKYNQSVSTDSKGTGITQQWSLTSNNRFFKELTLALTRDKSILSGLKSFMDPSRFQKMLVRLDVPAWDVDTEVRVSQDRLRSAGFSAQVHLRDDLLLKLAYAFYDENKKAGVDFELASQIVRLLNTRWQVEYDSRDVRNPSVQLSGSWGADAKHFASILSYELTDSGVEARVKSTTTPAIDRSGLAITWRPTSNEYRFAIALDIPDTTDVEWLAIHGGRVSTGTVLLYNSTSILQS